MNHEEQYSIWPADQDLPPGWESVGEEGSREACLEYISTHWTDMRPLSLRKAMEAQQSSGTPAGSRPTQSHHDGPTLVSRLCEGEHRVEASLRPERSLESLRRCIERDFVHILFPDTKGGTELSYGLDQELSDFTQADLDNGQGHVRLAGRLNLDGEAVVCIADIDLAKLRGVGRLERIG